MLPPECGLHARSLVSVGSRRCILVRARPRPVAGLPVALRFAGRSGLLSWMWRPARPGEDGLIVEMCVALNQEDPGEPVSADQVRRTLAILRAEPARGRSVVAEVDCKVVGYALLVSFWSNEYGGEICAIDELYVAPSHRSRGIATALFRSIGANPSLWGRPPVALELEVSPANARARALYERLGFTSRNHTLRRRL